MKEFAKSILLKVGLFESAKKIYSQLRKDNSAKVLKVENMYAVNRLSAMDLNSLTFNIRLQIHGIEKHLVKGDYKMANMSVLKSLVNKTQKVLDIYPEYSKNADLIVETMGILQGIIELLPERTDVKKLLNDFIEINSLQNITPRVVRIKKVAAVSEWKEYEGFISERHSIREYKKETVSIELVREVVELAMKCPSACNRQPCKVYYTNENEKIQKFRPDPFVSKDIYNFLIVTVNKSLFSSGEVLQAWINGGIFLESLVLAIHAKGLGSCLFQEIKDTRQYKEIKKTVKIPDNEDVVAMVGFGYLSESYPIIEMHRKDVDEVLVEF